MKNQRNTRERFSQMTGLRYAKRAIMLSCPKKVGMFYFLVGGTAPDTAV